MLKKLTFAILITVSGSAFAGMFGMKPGLWEVKIVQQISDGQDMIAFRDKEQQALAKMDPDKRKEVEAKLRGAGANLPSNSVHICMSQKMVDSDISSMHQSKDCKPGKETKDGDKSIYDFSCTSQGQTISVHRESKIVGDTISTNAKMTMDEGAVHHSTQSNLEMKFLGSDCQGVKPPDQAAMGQ